MGAELYGDLQHAQSLLAEIKGNDDVSIIKACQLVNYDMVYRIGARLNHPSSLIKIPLNIFNYLLIEV